MLPLVLLFIFWAVVPGLITGWMFRERGRRFAPGLLLGTVCGPVGILAALAFIYAAERRDARGRPSPRGRAVRVFYDIPVVGRLHVSTVWALAGLATFLCLWMVGGIGYDLYSERLNQAPLEAAAQATPGTPQVKEHSAANAPQAGTPPNDSRVAGPSQEGITNQPRAALLGNISGQPGQAAPANARPDNSSNAGLQPTWPDTSAAARPSQPEAQTSAPSPSPAQGIAAPSASARASAQSRDAAVSEVTRALSSQGQRVHAALSGDAQTSTLSLSGESLTREAGNQLLGNRRLRETLKAAGVRIVVMVNGQESWTYIL
ncbi:MAG: hypothetical protein M3444_07220 [Acidobacteriota bacterium]|nr:hypothetical protein [Acidobacteriota bacterium]